MVVAYDGTTFEGFQRQGGRVTVQGELETHLTRLSGHPVQVTAAGRTDTGVHASGQVIHFDTWGSVPPGGYEFALNERLSGAIRVRCSEETDQAFHARFSAISRSYRYWLCSKASQPFRGRWCWQCNRLERVKWDLVRSAAAGLVGRNDFAAFSRGQSGARSTVRTLRLISVVQVGSLTRLDMTADAFLRGMVRGLVGALVEVGSGRLSPEKLSEWLAEGRRESGLAWAPARGLFLASVEYPDGYGAGGDLEEDWTP